MLSFCLPMHNSKSDSYNLELNTYIATQNKRFVHPWHQSLKNTKVVGRLSVTKKGKQVKKREQERIHSSLRVAQNRMFVINPVYSGAGTMVVKILDFRLFESLKSALSRTFCFPQLSLESWMLHWLCENFPEYPPDIIIQTSIIVYLILQHFSWFKNYNLLILKPIPGTYFASAKTISAFVDPDLLLTMKMVAKSNAHI